MLARDSISNIHLKSFCSRRGSSGYWLCPHRDWGPPLCTPWDPGTPDVFLPGSAGCLQSATEILRVKVRAWVSKAPCHLQRNLPHTNQQTNTAPGRCATEFGRCFLITRCKIKINGVAEGWMQNDCFSCPFCATSQLSFYDINKDTKHYERNLQCHSKSGPMAQMSYVMAAWLYISSKRLIYDNHMADIKTSSSISTPVPI